MKKKINVHIYPSPMTHESRIFKQANSIRKLNIFDEIWLIGISTDGLPSEEILNDNIIIKRINVKLIASSSGNSLQTYALFYIKFIYMFLSKKPNMLNVHNAELLPLAAIVKLFKKCILIYDPHELESEKASAGLNRRKVIRFIEKKLIKYTDKVFVVGESIADFYKKNYPYDRPTVILNCPSYLPNKRNSKNYFREKFGISERKIIYLCQGVLTRHRGVEIIIDAFSKTNNHSIVVVFLGDGNLVEMIKESSKVNSNIYHHPAVSPEVLHNYTASADIGLSLINNISLSYQLCMPNKVFEYLMAGLPVIVSNLPEIRKVIESYEVGAVLEDYTSTALENLISRFDLSNIDKSNLEQAANHYNWENQESIMLYEYKRLLNNRRK